MSKIYYGDRASGGSLKHYRTKGSRNGYSKNPNYKVVGQRAKGKWVNGRYVYDQPTNNPMYSKTSSQSRGFLSQYSQGSHQRTSDPVRDKINEKAAATKVKLAAARGSQNNWQQQAARAQAGLQSNMRGPRTTPSGMGNDPRYTQQVQSQSKPGAASRVKQKARVAKAAAKGAQNDWQQQAIKAAAQGNLTGKIARGEVGAAKANNGDVYSARELGYQGSSKSKSAKRYPEPAYRDENGHVYNAKPNAMGKTYSPAYGERITDPRYNVKGTQKIEEAKKIAAQKAADKHNVFSEQNNGTFITEYNPKTKETTVETWAENEERRRIEEGKKRHAKVRAKRERAAKRAALINKIKDKISSFFKKKKK